MPMTGLGGGEHRACEAAARCCGLTADGH